jgi:hypothetical protein
MARSIEPPYLSRPPREDLVRIWIILSMMAVFTAACLADGNTGTRTSPGSVASTTVAVSATNNAPVHTNAPAERRPVLAYPIEGSVPPADLDSSAESAFAVGTRMVYARLVQPTKHTFLGHIDKLEVRQDLAPTRVFGQWFPFPDWGVELTWDEVHAKTFNNPGDDGVRTCDGDWLISGPIATVLWRYVNDSGWTPSVGVGAGFMSGDVDLAGWWHYGYNSPEQYAALGSPKTPYKAGMRTMDPNDPIALVVSAECDVRISDRWSADLYARYMSVDLDIHWTTKGDDKGTRTVPFDNYVLGLGAKYRF